MPPVNEKGTQGPESCFLLAKLGGCLQRFIFEAVRGQLPELASSTIPLESLVDGR